MLIENRVRLAAWSAGVPGMPFMIGAQVEPPFVLL